MMSKGIIYKGNVFIRLWVAGVLSSDIVAIGATKLTIKANAELKERFSKGRDDFGLVKGSVSITQPTEITLGFNEVDPKLFAMLFMGSALALNEAGGSVTGETITLKQGEWIKTAQRNISASAIATLVLGTDFIEHPRMGAIKALTPAAVGEQSLAYTYGAITGTRIAGGVAGKIEAEIVMDGLSLEDDSEAYVRIPKTTLVPISDVDLMAGEYVEAEMRGKAIKLDNEVGDVIFDDGVTYA